METKFCNKCNTEKERGDFSKKSKSKDGLAAICKECHSKYRKNYYRNNKNKELQQVKNYQSINKIHKKSGRTIKSTCRLKGCNNLSYLTKKESENNKLRYCSKECSYIGARVNPIHKYFKNIQRNAEKRGKKFNLTEDYILSLLKLQHNKCAITGIKIKLSHPNDKTSLEDASLDRIDSSKGYKKGNVQWVALGVNYMKRNFTDIELKRLLQKIKTSMV